jgi:hypothetical protein
MVASADAVTRIFRPYGPIDSVRVFSGRTYAFVNFVHEADAAAAKVALEMQARARARMLAHTFARGAAGGAWC